MDIDHIFIFTDDNGKVANELVEFGLTEGSSRIHKGQGTTNRKFYFDNFYFEILWVHNSIELRSEQTKPTGLWRRSEYKTNGYSPFGLCMVNIDETKHIFNNAFKYQPDYFPKDQVIDIIKNEHQPDLPWTFRLPFKGQNRNIDEPKSHKNGISVLTRVSFEYQKISDNSFIRDFGVDSNIEFIQTSRNWLNLTFDNNKQRKRKDFNSLFLTIYY